MGDSSPSANVNDEVSLVLALLVRRFTRELLFFSYIFSGAPCFLLAERFLVSVCGAIFKRPKTGNNVTSSPSSSAGR